MITMAILLRLFINSTFAGKKCMKHSSLIILNCLISCTTPYEHKGIKEITDILVVQGIISDYESFISLTRSVNITEADYFEPVNVENAIVYRVRRRNAN